METAYRILLISQAILIFFGLKLLIRNYGSRTSIVFGMVILGLVESLIGFLQVVFQGSIGWYLLGEPRLDILNPEVAKTIVSGGGRLLRAYGTFVHPNILGAFLVVSFLCLICLFLTPHPTKNNFERRLSLFIGCGVLFFLILGLILTFSRAAWLVSFLMGGFYLGLEFFRKKHLREKIIFLVIVIFIITTSLILIFHWVIFPKIYLSASEPAIQQRMDYLKLGWQSVKENPFFGVGLGQPIYKGQNQPIHNLYLLIASETGLVGLFLFFLFIYFIFRHSFEIQEIIFISILFLGMFDHYLWTIPAGQLLLWITIFFIVV